VTVLLYHLVFPAKYRRAVFDEAVDGLLRDVCLDLERRYQLKFLETGTDEDHVHLSLFLNRAIKLSRTHLLFVNLGDTGTSINYRIETPDFNDEGKLEEIGLIKIDRINKTYEFTPTNIWINYRFIPPWFFDLADEEQKQLLETKFKGYEAGG